MWHFSCISSIIRNFALIFKEKAPFVLGFQN